MNKKTVYMWALTSAMCWNINASSELTPQADIGDLDTAAAQEALVSLAAVNDTQQSQSAGEASGADEEDIDEELSNLVNTVRSNLAVNPRLGDDVSEADDVPVRGGPGSEQRRGRDRNREVNVDDVARVVAAEMQVAATTDEAESMSSGTDEESVVEGEDATQEESNLIARREQNDDLYSDDFEE